MGTIQAIRERGVMVAGPIVTPDWVMVDFDKLRERERERMNQNDEQIQKACGTPAPPDWTEQQKRAWLKREAEAQAARVASNINRQQDVIWPTEFSEEDKAAWIERQANKQKEQPDRRAKVTDPRIAPLERQRAILLTYLRSKLDADDMHGVQDAASDIREIDAKLNVLR